MTESRKISVLPLGEFVEEFKGQFSRNIDVGGQTIPLILEDDSQDTIKLTQSVTAKLPDWLKQARSNILEGVLDRHNNSCHENNGSDEIGVKIAKDDFLKSLCLKDISFAEDALRFCYESELFPEEDLFVNYFELGADFDYFAEGVDLEDELYPEVSRMWA